MRKILLSFFLVLPLMVWGQLQLTGPISIGDVRDETGTLFGPYSLGDGQTDYGVNSPVALSDFYGLSPSTCVSSSAVNGYSGGDLLYVFGSQPSNCVSEMEDYGATLYGSTSSLATTTGLYTQQNGCTPALSGWYSDGSSLRYWDASTETFTTTTNC